MEKKPEERLAIAMRAKVGILWVPTVEELRVERAVITVASELGYEVLLWSATKGLIPSVEENRKDEATRDPSVAVERFLSGSRRTCCIFRDLGPWLKDPVTLRTIKDANRYLPTFPKESAKQIVVIDNEEPPKGLIGTTVLDWPLPDRECINSILDSFLTWAPQPAVEDIKKNDNKNKIVSASLGLAAEEVGVALAYSLAATGKFDPSLVSREKERVVRGSGLEWYSPDSRGLDGIGGMDNLKIWLNSRRQGFTTAARSYGLPAPRGMLLLGVPGCGKSLTAKCVAAAWGLPLLRMDVGALFSKWVGESEFKVKQALKTAEAVAPCVLWVDEIEKAFSGSGEGDAGTSQRVFGSFLTWMQERKEGVFIVATANNVKKLPPEFLRAGRWDELFFVDLPTKEEREQILTVLSNKYPHCQNIDHIILAGAASDGYTGAEIECAIQEALFTAFSEKERDVKTLDVAASLKVRIPLAKTMREDIEALRNWSTGRARPASSVDTGTAFGQVRQVETN